MKGNLLAQYLRIKAEHATSILLFRLGDFYEMFFDDAKEAASLLDLTLTARNKGADDEVPLCGFPAHAAQPYITRLLGARKSVAVCEQVAAGARGLMEREVVRVITPGTVLEEESLDPDAPSLLAAVAADDGEYGLACVDFATGRVRVTHASAWPVLGEELLRLAPRELLVDETVDAAVAGACADIGAVVRPLPAGAPPSDLPADVAPATARAAAGLRSYVDYAFRGTPAHLRAPEPYQLGGFLTLDEPTRRNLELFTSLRGERRGSLIAVLDSTCTPMGSRLLREWLLYPPAEPTSIGRRLDAVEWFVEHPVERGAVRDALRGAGDLARLAGRVGAGSASPRDLRAVAASLNRASSVRDVLRGEAPPLIAEAADRVDPQAPIVERIEATLVDEAPPHTRIPGFIRDGCHSEVDDLRSVAHEGKSWIAAFEARERERTGIPGLKVRHNKVFGYYLEVRKTSSHLVPETYERKQTLVNAERFVTPELKEYESKVLGAEERLRNLEQHVFSDLLTAVQGAQLVLAQTAGAVAELDVVATLAEVAHRDGWVRPSLTRAAVTEIVAGRHPVVEALASEPFVPNDTHLASDQAQLVILTGPNMGGKSTYLRQVALITILAHMGSFVPAHSAEIGITDRIFTRVGASDDLARGESTFMVEMRETANILTNLTDRSLVVLDEIGRGTSTFDGISIAWAVAEHLHDSPQRPRTLFATHYHELTALTAERERTRNLSVAVAEWKGDVVFLRQIVEGPAPRSYGVDVAKLAGVPEAVVARARELLGQLEAGEGPAHGPPAVATEQLSLFEDQSARLTEALARLDTDQMTPLDALAELATLVQEARRLR